MPRNHRPSVRLNVEQLESRDVPSSAMIDPGQYASDQILVRWQQDAPVASDYSDGWTDLGNNTYAINLVDGIPVANAVAFYSSLPGVDFAQPDYVLHATRTANDTQTSNQWALQAIDAPTAWNTTTGSKAIIVAVIDTGVDYTHPDLAANAWTNTGEIAGNGRDDDGNGYVDDIRGWDFANNDAAPLDDNGHGTHVAGIIGAVGNNATGVTGLNWNVQIMSLKFMNANGSGLLSNAVKSINYAVRMGAKVINNSWTGGGVDTAMASALTYAQSRGVIVVAAAGNNGTNNDITPRYPASYGHDNLLSVAATDKNNNLASYSNYGATSVDIAAPGSSILSTVPNNKYAYYSGTSMASPYVAGAVALLWSAKPEWSYRQVISHLMNTTDKLPSLNGKVQSGLLDIGRAISTAVPAPTPTPTPAPSNPTTPGLTVIGANFLGGTGFFNNVRVTFSSAVNPATFDANDLALTDASGRRIAVSRVSPVAGTNNQFNVYFVPQRVAGAYQVVVGPDIRDLSNRAMDQNRNGVAGEAGDRFTHAQTLSLGGASRVASSSFDGRIEETALAAWAPPTVQQEWIEWGQAAQATEPTVDLANNLAVEAGLDITRSLTLDPVEVERMLDAMFVNL